METRRHHFLPRFLLKGFASRSRRDSYFTYLFTREGRQHETNITNVAVAGDFYGREADGGVESGLRESESQHATVLHRIRSEGLDNNDRLILGEFVRHLLVRTRHMRETAGDLAGAITALMRQLLPTTQMQEKLKQEISKRALGNESLWAQMKAKGVNLTEQQMTHLVDLAMAQIDLASGLRLYSDALELIDVLGAAAAGQIGALRRATGERPVPPDDVIWSLTKTEPHFFILGDLAVIGRTADGYCHPMQPDAGLEAIVLPIGHQHLLIGALTPTIPTIDPEQVNDASVELSRDFFVASRNTQREQHYQARLGARAKLPGLSEMLTRIAMDSLTGEVRPGSETPASPNLPPLS
jgi:Protein of unknown function (DUF4238)